MPEFCVDMSENKGYCIGEVNKGGCEVVFDESKNQVTASYDFRQTKSDICSVVFFTGEMDMHKQFIHNSHLCFQIKTQTNSIELTIELRLKNSVVSYNIKTSTDWENYSIPLQAFGGAEVEWDILREIKFLVYRFKSKRETIYIKEIKIV